MATNLRQSSCPQALSRQSLWRDSCSRRRRWQEKRGKPLSGGRWMRLCSSGRKVGSALLGDNSDWQVVCNILALVGRKWEGGRKTVLLTLVGSRMCFLKRDWGRSKAERSRWIVHTLPFRCTQVKKKVHCQIQSHYFFSDFRRRWCWNLTAGEFWEKIIFAFCNGVIFTRPGGF